MSSDLTAVWGLAATAMLNPSLVAATTAMLFLPGSQSLMLGYLLGAYTTSIGVGLVLVFSLQGSSFASASKHTISPTENIALGAILLAVAFVLATGRDEPVRARRRSRKEAKARAGKEKEPWSQRMLGRGSVSIAFVVGALLSFPGVSYLAALSRIAGADLGTLSTVLLVIGFCIAQLLVLEVVLLGSTLAPERTQRGLESARAWVGRRGRRVVVVVAVGLGVVLVLRGIVNAW
jgi:hypothetical protein